MHTPVDLDPLLHSQTKWRQIAWWSWFALVILCILWEAVLAPIKPGGSWAVIKVIPLLFALKGIWQGSSYTMQWSSMLVMLYFMEGVVRLTDPGLSGYLAGLEILLSLTTYFALLAYLKPLKKVAKQKKLALEKLEKEQEAKELK
jgi:uncharacterized membrane protein